MGGVIGKVNLFSPDQTTPLPSLQQPKDFKNFEEPLSSLSSTVSLEHANESSEVFNYSPKILILQNDKICPPHLIADILQSNNIPYQVVYTYYNNGLKNINPKNYKGIIVLGGEVGCYEEDTYIWLKSVKEFMKLCLNLEVPILGICLGAQLLALACGGNVYKGTKLPEIGYYKLTYLNNNGQEQGQEKEKEKEKGEEEEEEDIIIKHYKKYEWDKYIVLSHGDTFDNLPEYVYTNNNKNKQKLQLLCRTDKYNNIFKIGKYTYGMQSHPEAGHDLIKLWLDTNSQCNECDNINVQQLKSYIDQNSNLIIQSGKDLIFIWLNLILFNH